MTKLEQSMHLEQQLNEVMENKGIEGVMCINTKGLCLKKKGKTPEHLAGPISALCNEAKEIQKLCEAKENWTDENPPQILLAFNGNSSSKTIHMQLCNNVCTAIIHKKT